MADLTRGKTFTATEQVTNTKLHELVDSGSVSNVVQADLAANLGLVTRSGSAPADTDSVWVDTVNGLVKVYIGSAWVTIATIASPVQGNIIYHNGTTWVALAPGTSGYYLKTQGASANPTWAQVNERIVQVVNTTTGAAATGTTVTPLDDTVPQNTEGTNIAALNCAITPTATTNKLKIDVVVIAGLDGADVGIVALHQDSTAGALAAALFHCGANEVQTVKFTHYMDAGTTSETTFKVNIGTATGVAFRLNGANGAGRKLGGVLSSSVTVTEIKV